VLLAAVTVVSGLSAAQPPAANAAATCSPTPETLQPVVRLNAGGPQVLAGGVTWQADRYYTGGTTSTWATSKDIQGSTADAVYRSSRVGGFGYEIPVPAVADYVVRVHEAEVYFGAEGRPGGPGSRVFSLNLEGGPEELSNYDIAASVGSMRAVVKQFRLPVSDGRLSITSSALVGQAKMSGLEVLRVRPGTTCPTPPTSGFGIGTGRPFADDSAWNVPVDGSPVLDRNSDAIIASLTPRNAAYADLYEFGAPIFNADAGSPSYQVQCTMPWGTCDLQKQPIRIPAEAMPNNGSDGGMIVIDWTTRLSCDFWQAQKTAQGWRASWGTCASLDGDGSGPSGGATGAGVNGLAGTVRTYEIAQRRIDHALNFATNNSCQQVYRFPATKTDGASSRGDCLPEGARVQLDPSVDVDALPGITPGERTVAHALQTYGAYNRDNAGAPIAFGFEKPTTGVDPYPAAGFAWDYYDMPHIPWNKLRVLHQWDGQ